MLFGSVWIFVVREEPTTGPTWRQKYQNMKPYNWWKWHKKWNRWVSRVTKERAYQLIISRSVQVTHQTSFGDTEAWAQRAHIGEWSTHRVRDGHWCKRHVKADWRAECYDFQHPFANLHDVGNSVAWHYKRWSDLVPERRFRRKSQRRAWCVELVRGKLPTKIMSCAFCVCMNTYECHNIRGPHQYYPGSILSSCVIQLVCSSSSKKTCGRSLSH